MRFTALDQRIWIKGLTVECPLIEPMNDCPLNALRHLPLAQMNIAINGLSDKQVDSIATIHQHCHHDRLKAIKRSKR